jgi:predicted dehydrogenase
MATGPLLAAGPQTCVTGVWNRTPEYGETLADELSVPVFSDIDALIDSCDAVAISISPVAQPAIAVRAAHAGKALLLEKPLGDSVASARTIVDAVHETGVGALVMLSNRFNPLLDEFFEAAARCAPVGGAASFVSGASLGGPFATDWRLARGAVLDVGPHMLDMLEGALGEIVDVHAAGDPCRWVSLLCTHASGATSVGSVSLAVAAEGSADIEVYGPKGSARYDGAVDHVDWANRVRSALVAVAGGASHPANVDHALHLQDLIARIETQLD